MRPRSPRSPSGESEADLFLTTDKTEAGKSADCAHRTKHDQVAFKACVTSERNYVDMSGAYDFTLPARGRVRIVDAGSVDAPPIHVRGVHISFVLPKDGRRHVVAKEVFVRPTAPAPSSRSPAMAPSARPPSASFKTMPNASSG